MRSLAGLTVLLAGAEAFAFGPAAFPSVSGRHHVPAGALALRAASGGGTRRDFVIAVSAAGLAQLAAPQGAAAIDFRKMVTGEETGKERASERLKREKEANGGASCEVYECYSIDDNELKGSLARVSLDGISVMAPTKSAGKFEVVDSAALMASWKDGTGAFVEVASTPVADFGFELTNAKNLPPPPLGASALKVNIAGVGALVAKARSKATGDKHTFVNGRGRLLQEQTAVVYVMGVRNDAKEQTVLVGVTQKDGKIFTVSCGASTKVISVVWNASKRGRLLAFPTLAGIPCLHMVPATVRVQ